MKIGPRDPCVVRLTAEERAQCLVFAIEVIQRGQSAGNYRSSRIRNSVQHTADTYRGKIVEVAVCKAFGMDPASLSWTVGLGPPGLTSDGGVDLEIFDYRFSVNAISEKANWLLIPEYKSESHIRAEVDFIVLGTTQFGRPTTDEELEREVRKDLVRLDGWLMLEQFLLRMTRIEAGGRFNLDADNVGIPRRGLNPFLELIHHMERIGIWYGRSQKGEPLH